MNTVTLPYPPAILSPNSRAHWAKLARAKKAYRSACAWAARGQGLQAVKNAPEGSQAAHGGIQEPHVLVSLRFNPPDRRARDMDNALAALKSGLDGLVDVLGIDDSHWVLQLHLGWGEPVKGGAVQVTLEVC